MRVLVVNDDGISGKGLHVLSEVLGKEHEVWVIAPDRNRSGVSHSITMSEPLKLTKIADKKYTCSGVPVDCTLHGCRGVLPFTPDAVVSGINKGANLGTDILFSGTAAAARQAVLYGVPGIAVSLESKSDVWNYHPLAEFVADNLETLVSLCEKEIFVNVNAMDLGDTSFSYKGAKMTTPSIRDYRDSLELYYAPDGSTYSFFQGGSIETCIEKSNDFTAVQDGYVAVSRIYAQPLSAPHKDCDNFTFRKNTDG